MRRFAPLLLAAATLAVAAGCLIATDSFGGKTCVTNADCPQVEGYHCVSATTWPQVDCGADEKHCTCEVRFPPAPDLQSDGGINVVDAGPPPDYCTEVRPILQLSCLGTCHGAQMGYANSPIDFRLDYYQRPAPALPGVKARADRVQDRIYVRKDMPPLTDIVAFAISNDQRALVNKWVKAGAPYGSGHCEDDAGVDPPKLDAGTDAGVDAGVVIRYATDIQPIFQARCGGGANNCHFMSPPRGGLSLTAANSYNQLVNNANNNTNCTPNNGATKRVVPNNTAQSMLWRKLAADGQKCGDAMPDGTAGLITVDNQQFQKVVQWINQGAPNN